MKEVFAEYSELIENKFGVIKTDSNYEEYCDYMFLLYAPAEYKNVAEMLKYVKANPDKTVKEYLDYFRSITPPGLAPEDDGKDLLE